MYDIAILVFAAASAIFGLVAVLPLFGFDLRIIGRPKVPLEQIESPPRPTRKAWAALLIAIMSMGLSAGALYYFFHPKIVEKTIEKAVASPCPEQKEPAVTTIPNGKPLKQRGHIEANPTNSPKAGFSVPSQNCPNGICIGGENSGNPTVINEAPKPQFTATVNLVESDRAGYLKTEIKIVPNIAIPPPIEMVLDFDNPVAEIGGVPEGAASIMLGGRFRYGTHTLSTIQSPGISPRFPMLLHAYSLKPLTLIKPPYLEGQE
jgi:hypothetical protein